MDEKGVATGNITPRALEELIVRLIRQVRAETRAEHTGTTQPPPRVQQRAVGER